MTYALVALAVLLYCLCWTANLWVPAVYPRTIALFGPRSADALLRTMTDQSDSMALSRNTCLFPILVSRGKDPANRAQLVAKAGQDDLEGDYANLALFRLRDNPRTRLSAIMDRFNRRPLYDPSVIDSVLVYYLDAKADKPYTDIIVTALDKAPDIERQQVLLASLSRFASDPVVLSKITEKLKATDLKVRLRAVEVLGEAAQRDPHAKQLPAIVDVLYGILDDPATDFRVRDDTLYSLAKHGWTERFESRILSIFRHGNYAQRNVCIGASTGLPEHGKALKILFTMLMARNPVNLFDVILAIIFVIILYYWWLLLMILIVSIAVRPTVRLIRQRRFRPSPPAPPTPEAGAKGYG